MTDTSKRLQKKKKHRLVAFEMSQWKWEEVKKQAMGIF